MILTQVAEEHSCESRGSLRLEGMVHPEVNFKKAL